MKRFMLLCFACFILISVPGAGAQTEVTKNLTQNHNQAMFVYDDVLLFIAAYEKLNAKSDSLGILQTEYLDRGTPGLKMFIEKYDLTAERLVKAIQKHPEKYAGLEDIPELLREKIPLYREAFGKLKRCIPEAVYPPTYFLIEAYRGIGSGSIEGQLISVEKWTRPLEDKRTLLIHELVHFQQVLAVGYDKYAKLFGPEKNLLGLCIREGTAEFFADLVTGTITQDEAVTFTKKNEKKLWEWFRRQMHGRETGDWMWKKPEDPEQPYHVGYVMGYLIVESYYENAGEKTRAVQDIISVTDYPAFLQNSGYEEKFSD
jgi:hypothetical protein